MFYSQPNSINQQDYGQIGKDDSTAVIKNY